jgi:hypothetical protein
VLLQVAYSQRGEVQAVRYEVEAVAAQQANAGKLTQQCLCVQFYEWPQWYSIMQSGCLYIYRLVGWT